MSLKLYPISYFKIGYSQTANAFIQCCLKQQHLLAWCIHNVSTVTDTLTIYAKKNCGTSADNWFMASFLDEWTQWYSCGRLGTLQGEVLKNWTIFSYYEQHYWKFFFPWPWLVDFCFCLFFSGPWMQGRGQFPCEASILEIHGNDFGWASDMLQLRSIPLLINDDGAVVYYRCGK